MRILLQEKEDTEVLIIKNLSLSIPEANPFLLISGCSVHLKGNIWYKIVVMIWLMPMLPLDIMSFSI